MAGVNSHRDLPSTPKQRVCTFVSMQPKAVHGPAMRISSMMF